MKRIFITRDLQSSKLPQLLASYQIEVTGESLIDIQPISFYHVPEAHWIFFYSSRGAYYFFEELKRKNISVHALWAAMGPGTANKIKAYQKIVHFTGTGNPKSTATAFLERAENLKVLFPRAKNSKKSIQTILERKIKAIDLIVYDNQPKADFYFGEFDSIVFTSPMNAQAYFSEYEIKEKQQIIAIGPTTTKALQQLGVRNIHTADKPTEAALAKLLINH